MHLTALETVESWHAAMNARDDDQLCALTAHDVELIGPRGTARGLTSLRLWVGRAAYTAQPLRWFCGRKGHVVVEQRGRWTSSEVTSERNVASAFSVQHGRVVRYQRFDSLEEALAACALTDDDEVLARS
jgi:ketosteroid isomerase-like protein